MARAYLAEIRTVEPDGPYVLGGWCLGGDVAFEMAQQLRRAGKEVALVLMVDNPRPEYVATGPSAGPKRVLYRAGGRLAMERSNYAEVPRGERAGFVLQRTGRLVRQLGSTLERAATGPSGRLPVGLPHSRAYRQLEVASRHEKAYEEYRPQPYAGRVAVLRAERQPWGRAPDPSLGWSALVDGPVMTCALPGHRIGLLEGPRSPRVAAIIDGVLRAALEHGSTNSR
jgi:thioesterase domain-containing protein